MVTTKSLTVRRQENLPAMLNDGLGNALRDSRGPGKRTVIVTGTDTDDAEVQPNCLTTGLKSLRRRSRYLSYALHPRSQLMKVFF